MLLLMLPRYGSTSIVVDDEIDTHDGVRRRKYRSPEIEPKKPIDKAKLLRVRASRKRLSELKFGEVESVEFTETDSLVAKELGTFAPDVRERLSKALSDKILAELQEILRGLSTAQIEEARAMELLRQIADEELTLMMVMI